FLEVGGARTYNSWLHERPSAIDGRWSLKGNRLRMDCCEGLEYDFIVVRITANRLVLREAGTASTGLAELRRIPVQPQKAKSKGARCRQARSRPDARGILLSHDLAASALARR